MLVKNIGHTALATHNSKKVGVFEILTLYRIYFFVNSSILTAIKVSL